MPPTAVIEQLKQQVCQANLDLVKGGLVIQTWGYARGVERTRGLVVFKPNPTAQAVYRELYALYKKLHDAFGTKDWSGNLHGVMKELIAIRSRVRK